MRLNQELNRIKGGTRRGLIKVGFVIKAQSMKNAPIDTSNLRASHYVWWKGGAMETPSYNRNGRDGEEKLTESDLTQLRQAYQEELSRAAAEIRDFEIRIGASAHYALAVHEGDPSANWNNGAPKYLEKAVNTARRVALRMVANDIGFKG